MRPPAECWVEGCDEAVPTDREPLMLTARVGGQEMAIEAHVCEAHRRMFLDDSLVGLSIGS